MRSKRPTLAQKKLMKRWRLNPEEWMVQRALPYETKITHRSTCAAKTIPEGQRGRREYQEAI